LGINLLLLCLLGLEGFMVRLAESYAEYQGRSAVKSVLKSPTPEVHFALKDEAEYSHFVDRPLFNGDRKPRNGKKKKGGKVKETVAAQDLPPSIALMGVLLSERQRVAIIKGVDGKPKRFRIKDLVEGWELLGIDPDHITLSNGSRVEDLRIQPRVANAVPVGAESRVPLAAPPQEPVQETKPAQANNLQSLPEKGVPTEGQSAEEGSQSVPQASSPPMEE
jgi:hypothetical protein